MERLGLREAQLDAWLRDRPFYQDVTSAGSLGRGSGSSFTGTVQFPESWVARQVALTSLGVRVEVRPSPAYEPDFQATMVLPGGQTRQVEGSELRNMTHIPVGRK